MDELYRLGSSAYENKPWINQLVSFIASLPKSHPKLRIIGICYGHQIVARAFGSSVEKNAKGWELGVRTVKLTELGKRLLQRDQTEGHDSIVSR